MSYGDTVVRRAEDAVDDEYQAQVTHKASTVGLQYCLWSTMALAALLAWVLPGALSLWSFAVLVIPGVAAALGAGRWMRRHAPRPRYIGPTATDWAVILPAAAVMLAGILVHAFDGRPAAAAGMVTGGIIAGVAAPWVTRRRARRGRQRDERRLDADLED